MSNSLGVDGFGYLQRSVERVRTIGQTRRDMEMNLDHQLNEHTRTFVIHTTSK